MGKGGKRGFKECVKHLTDLGYVEDRTNSKGFHIFTHPVHGEVAVGPWIDERSVRRIIRDVDKRCGVERDRNKRNPEACKQRQAAEREQLRQRDAQLAAERERLLADRDRQLDGLGAVLSEGEIGAIEQRIRELDSERREIEALMREAPGRDRAVAHRAGAR